MLTAENDRCRIDAAGGRAISGPWLGFVVGREGEVDLAD
jgi:hypothetical protein